MVFICFSSRLALLLSDDYTIGSKNEIVIFASGKNLEIDLVERVGREFGKCVFKKKEKKKIRC